MKGLRFRFRVYKGLGFRVYGLGPLAAKTTEPWPRRQHAQLPGAWDGDKGSCNSCMSGLYWVEHRTLPSFNSLCRRSVLACLCSEGGCRSLMGVCSKPIAPHMRKIAQAVES